MDKRIEEAAKQQAAITKNHLQLYIDQNEVGLTNKAYTEGWAAVPVCLVPSELLDWVEGMREQLEARSQEDSSTATMFLDELNAIWPRK